MNDNELNRARKNYEKQLKQNKICLAKKEEAIKLLEDPNVKRFLDLQKYLKYQEPTSVDMAEKAFNLARLSSINSNQIFVYAGSYDCSGNCVSNTNDSIVEKSFWDLETVDTVQIPILDCPSFEKEHLIIYMPEFIRTTEDFNRSYFKLRRYFLSELIDKPQDEVIKSLRKHKNIERILERKDL